MSSDTDEQSPRRGIRILVVDDHPVVRDGLVAILSTQPDLEVVGEAGSAQEALAKAAALKPDVALVDLEMPGMSGIKLLEHLQRDHPVVRALVFTAFDRDDQILGAVRAGAKGYLLKGAPREELFRAVRVIHQGGSLLEPVVASKLLQHVGQSVGRPGVHDGDPSGGQEPSEELTEREIQVLKLLAEGLTNRQIAQKLFVSERTVKFHVSSLLGKLGAQNRTEVVRVALQRGLVSL